MMRPELLKMVVCPETRTELSEAPRELLDRLNQAIAGRKLTNKAGQTLERKIDGGLLRADGQILYPVVDEIPMLLVDEGISLDQECLSN